MTKDYSAFKKKLESELHPEDSSSPTPSGSPTESYSAAYRKFKLQQTSKSLTFYERACNASEKFLKVGVKEKYRDKVGPAIKLAHLDITPEGALAFTYLVTLVSLLVFVSVGLLLGNFMLLLAGPLASVLAFFLLPKMPNHILNVWRAKASEQLITAVLYMIIYMEHTPNLELAINFTAKHLPPPLSLDFMKILWDVETKKFASVSEALEGYVEVWRGKNNDFIESIHLVESSLYASDPKRSKEILNRAVQTILDGTQDHMLNYAHNLQSPIQSVHMLGIVLPVMGLVMLPMISAFMGESIRWWYIFGLYNIFLPIVVFLLGRTVLETRPSGSSQSDIYYFLRQKHSKPRVFIKGKPIPLTPKIFGILLFILFSAAPFYYFYSTFTVLQGEALRLAMHSTVSLVMSMLIIAGAGLGIGSYYYYSANFLIDTRRKTEQIENEFASAIFELGNRIEEDIPTEIAISKVSELMKKSAVADLFNTIIYNIRQRGMSLKQAIFDSKVGAVIKYPSAVIRSVMNVLVESAKKGPQVAAHSLITISRYLTAVHKVNERLKDLLADTIASMEMQAKMFVPLISGIVVGLAALTMGILIQLGTQLGEIGTIGGEGSEFTVGASILDIFQFDAMLPSFAFQLFIGIYTIQIIFILSYLLNGVVNGPDKIERDYQIGQNLFIGTIIYLATAIGTTLLFNSLTSGITATLT